jgi:hypothetical protein
MRKLIKLRGAGRFETEIERQMLMAQTGTIVSEGSTTSGVWKLTLLVSRIHATR